VKRHYVLDEGFSERHVKVLVKIVGLFNDCEDSEREVFEFVDRLYDKYVG